MMNRTEQQFAKHLVDARLAGEEEVRLCAEDAQAKKESFFTVVLRRGLLTEEKMLEALSAMLKIPVVDLGSVKADPAVAERVSLKIAEYYRIAPLSIEKRKLRVAVSQPLDLRAQDDLRAHLGFELEIALARQPQIVEYWKRLYGFAAGTIDQMVAQQQAQPAKSGPEASQAFETIENLENVEKLAGDASIAKLVNQIILEAYRKRATDIHLEPYRGKVKLRYRIDGILYNTNVSAEIARFIQPILSRIKIMSNLNIVEKRLPQDGRAIVKVDDTQLDLRVSSIPTPYGESVVIRMLPMDRIFDLGQLGLSSEQRMQFETLIEKPHGVIFITGPTGSGKSTTLYACLNKINTDERKIITIEDPVEYEMEGVTQIQVMSNIGLDFARGLRSMLRHDPDVMMVGEVRDLETAEMAIRVALTGHLVFSTLHTNDAASGITRLVDIGIAPYLVASSVEAFIAQRLVRMICKSCREEDKEFPGEVKMQIAKEIRLGVDKLKIFKGRGCNECNGTGFWGRAAIFETLLIDEEIKRLIMRRASSGEITRSAHERGMKSLRWDGWMKVVAGLTTPAEIFEATPDEPITAETPSAPVELSLPRESTTEERETVQIDKPSFERRTFRRLDSSVNVAYRVVKPESIRSRTPIEEHSVTKNVSAGGLALFLHESFPAGAVLELRFHIPGAAQDIRCLSKIVRIDEVESTGLYEAGICFLDISTRDRQTIEKYIVKESNA